MKKASVTVVQKIDAPVKAVWETISAIGGVEKWLGMIETCRVEGEGTGAKRFCTMTDGNTLNENIDVVDHENKVFQYSIPEPPMPIKDLVGTMKVSDTGKSGETEVTWSASFQVDEANELEMKAMIEGAYIDGITGIGRVSAA